jgi:RNA polymerase, sigma 27/28 subunit, RpsK/SigK
MLKKGVAAMWEVVVAILASIVKEILNLGYLTNTNSFPNPLTPEEEKKYLEAYRNGDEEARNILIERNLRLVAHVVKKYSGTGKDIDDLISIGTIGLIKAISTFDSSKGTHLATYAARCIENEILMSIRTEKKMKGEVFLQDPIGVDKEGNEISLMDVLGTEEDEISEQVEKKLQIKKLYSKMNSVLKNREKLIIEMRYGLYNGKVRTQREIDKNAGYISIICFKD